MACDLEPTSARHWECDCDRGNGCQRCADVARRRIASWVDDTWTRHRSPLPTAMLVWYGEQPWGITPLAGSQGRTQDLPHGKPVTWPLGHGSCIEEEPYCFSKSSINFKGHMGKKSPILTQILVFLDCNSVWIHRWLWNDAQSLMWYRKGAPLFFKVIHQISRSHSPKNWSFESNFRNITRPVVAIKSLRFACVTLKFHIWPWKIIGHIF